MSSSKIVKKKRPLATFLSSIELAELDRDVTERSIFSARTTEQGYIEAIVDIIASFADGEIGEGEARIRIREKLEEFGYTPESGFTRATETARRTEVSKNTSTDGGAIKPEQAQSRQAEQPKTEERKPEAERVDGLGVHPPRKEETPKPLGSELKVEPTQVPPAAPGSIEDLSSFQRINLVVQTQTGMAASISRIAGETPETLLLFPAYRFIRFMTPNTRPRDWVVRWAAAGDSVNWVGALRNQFVARKDSPIWQALGDGAGGFSDTLHNPYPPFAFNSGMGWEDVDREEARSLGLDVDSPVRLEKPSFAVEEDEMERAAKKIGIGYAESLAKAIHDA